MCIHTCLYLSLSLSIYIYTFICIHIYIYIYIYIYMYTHILSGADAAPRRALLQPRRRDGGGSDRGSRGKITVNK